MWGQIIANWHDVTLAGTKYNDSSEAIYKLINKFVYAVDLSHLMHNKYERGKNGEVNYFYKLQIGTSLSLFNS